MEKLERIIKNTTESEHIILLCCRDVVFSVPPSPFVFLASFVLFLKSVSLC